MTIAAWPFDEQEITETQFSIWAAMISNSGIDGVGDFEVTAGSGFTLNSAAGSALVRGYAVNDPDDEDKVVEPADTAERIDRFVLEIDPASNTGERKIVKGTPGAGAPVLVQTVAGIFQFPLCRIRVGANAVNIVSGDLTDERVVLGVDWARLSGKPTTFTPSAHTHPVAQLSDGGAVGRTVVQAGTAIAAREAIRLFKGTGPGSPLVDDLRYRDV